MENVNEKIEYTDVLVVGLGHAGCEAALATSRLGLDTIAFTVAIDNIAQMPCNPNIGGTSKGHIVFEVDALGGEMGKNIDKTFIQSKMLNKSKGPAVHSLRAQADKQNYVKEMRKTIENQEHLKIKQQEVKELLYENVLEEGIEKKIIKGIRTVSGSTYYAKVVILTTGVYLNSRCLYGEVIEHTGPNGLKNATYLTDSIKEMGIETLRFKTGTPARIDKRSIDFSKLEVQKGDENITAFSIDTDKEKINEMKQEDCFLAYTNEETHKIIIDNINRSPLFNGVIEGVGPRYCPSIEDKVMRFRDKDRHQVFVEPEGLYTNEVYLSGLSTSLPEDVQEKFIRTMKGFENAHIVRPGYAIEYDLVNPCELLPTLECKKVRGLFCAGQINGSSGYEEAAGQGLIAGINAERYINKKEQIILKRSDAYIGVLIDDLVTKPLTEPYRMMTSRAEYRLLLRQDNAKYRLSKIGYEVGLVSEERYKKILEEQKLIEEEINRLNTTYVGANDKVNNFLKSKNINPLESGTTLSSLIKRPELNYEEVKEIDEKRPDLSEQIKNEVYIEIKYEGYIERETKQVENFKKMEEKKIPQDFDYDLIHNLRIEAKEKLKKYKPINVGMASRISGVSPSDIAALLVFLKSTRE